jgi:broad specificity phosphatase PhoE
MLSVFNNEDQVRGALLRKPSEKNYVLPGINRIILVRHGESLGNVDESAYATTADWKIPITERGREQARMAGKSIANQLGEKGKIFFYFSPYLRTRQTLREILREIDKECIVGMREEPRM